MSEIEGISSLDKAIPFLRIDELNANSSRYDHLVAAPPDEQLVKYWYAWAALAYANGLFSFLIFLSVVTNKRAREKPFNLYLIYLMVPDFVFSLLCGTTCLLNALKGAYWSHSMCNFQQFYVVFGIGANAWINAIIAYQLHMILEHSKSRRRYIIPSTRQVTVHAMAVYLWCIFLGCWGLVDTENFPFHSGQASGLACLPLEGESKEASLFFWLCFFPLFAGIPIFYVLWVCWKIFYDKLMPPPGRRRLFTIYFGRLIIVFLIMWLPTLLFLFLLGPWLPQWVDFVGGAWSHLQGGVSAFLVLLKPDIWDTFQNFITCGQKKENCESDNSNRSRSSRYLSSVIFGSGIRVSYFWPRRSSEIRTTPEDIFNDNDDDLEDDDDLGDDDDLEDDLEEEMEEDAIGSDRIITENLEENNISGECSQSTMEAAPLENP